MSEHPSLQPFRPEKDMELKRLLQKTEEIIKEVQVPLKSLSLGLVDVDKLNEAFVNAKTYLSDSVSCFQEYLDIQMRRTDLSKKDLEETKRVTGETAGKIESISGSLGDISGVLLKLGQNADLEREVLADLRRVLAKY